MNYYAKHAASLGASQARLGTDCPVVTWANQDWAIIPGSAVRRKDLGSGGFQLDADFRFEALVQTFVTPGAPGGGPPVIATAKDLQRALLQTEVGYLGDDYKVVAVHLVPGGLVVRVECNAKGQNA